MATYLWRCKTDGTTLTTTAYASTQECPACHRSMARNYREESVGINKEGIRADQKEAEFYRKHKDFHPSLFLPTKDEYAQQAHAAGDPHPEQTAEKKMNNWMERMRPAESNKRPLDPRKL